MARLPHEYPHKNRTFRGKAQPRREIVPNRALPTNERRSYRNALLRVTIALAVGLAFAPRMAISAPLPGTPFGTRAEEIGTPAGSLDDEEETAEVEAEAEVTTDADRSGDADGEGESESGPGTSLRALSCLEGEGGNEQDGARRGVQKRDFLKKWRFELSALGGYYASDALSSTYLYGGALSFFLSEDFGIEAMVVRNPVRFRLEEAFNSFDRERHFQSGTAWNFLGAMLWSPIHAKLRWSERNITHADLLIIAGGGQTAHDTVQGLTFQVGAGLKLYLSRFVSLRFDVRDLMVPQEVLGRGRTTHNLVTMLGFCLWLPG